MVIVRAPYRLSFAGGGSDFPQWYQQHGGTTVATDIDKFCYLTCRRLPAFFDYKSRFVWSRIEQVTSWRQIVHPAIKGTLKYLNMEDDRLLIHHDGDLPARSGLGSSAAFTVALLHALYALTGRLATKRQLALEAIRVDHDFAGDIGGCQDQIMSASGGLNVISFHPGPDRYGIEWHPVPLTVDTVANIEKHLMLFYTGQARDASKVEQSKLDRLADKTSNLLEQKALVDPAVQYLMQGEVEGLARVLSRSWALKKQLSPEVSNETLDRYYAAGIAAGALGGKVAGAGGGGCLLFVVPPNKQADVKGILSGLLHIPFRFEGQGSQLIYYRP